MPIKPILTRQDGQGKTPDRLVINGQILDGSQVEGEDTWEVSIRGWKDAELLRSLQFCNLCPPIDSVTLPLKLSWNPYMTEVEITFKDYQNDSRIQVVNFFCGVELDRWAKPYSLADYLECTQDCIDGLPSQIIQFEPDSYGEDNYYGWTFTCALQSLDAVVDEELRDWLEQFKVIDTKAIQMALKNCQKGSLVTFFDFPAELKASCQQYLVYFVQFLEDLGIKANSEIKEDAGHILFSVTPADGPNALGKIKDALEAYLDLPRNPEFNATAEEFSDIAVSQLKANVFFLKSQLALAQATLETKNATIEALNFTVFQQRQLLTESVLNESVQESEKDCEPIVGDTVHLTKYEGKFLKVDLPTILRRLKRSFGAREK